MLDVDLASSSLGAARGAPVWVAFESTTQTYPVKPKRRKGARGRVSAEEMTAIIESGGKNNNSRLRPDQIEALRLKREPKDHTVTCLEQEDGEGNVEYKYRIKDPHPVRLQQLITQLKYRLSEGNGECFYYIGVEDNGYPKGLEPADLDGSIATLQHMAASLGACVSLEACHTDLRIAVAGSVEAGKSTLVAVLSTGSDGRPLLDNGRGLARMAVFRHKHEMQSGRTSSICHQLLGYDADGRVINYATPAATALTPAEITGAAAKVLTFLDMGGHEKYLKTALYGMTALLPDYSLLCVCAAAGLGRVAREHLAVAVALEVPVAVIITKVELVRPERFAAVVDEVRQLVALTLQHESGSAGGAAPAANDGDHATGTAAEEQRRVEEASPLVGTEAEAMAAARVLGQLHADSLASPTARGALRVHMPIFAVSAVTGAGLTVDGTFEVEGVGSVVSGTLVSGTLRLGQALVLGPTAAGGFTRVTVRQLQRSHVQVNSGLQLASSLGACGPGCSPPGLGSLAAPARKGAVLLEPALQPRTSWSFEAVLILLGGHWPPRGLLSGRWPPLDEDDPAYVVNMQGDLGCLVRVVLRWQHRPEWLREGAKLLVRDRSDGRIAGAGFVRRAVVACKGQVAVPQTPALGAGAATTQPEQSAGRG
eukprot:XP_001696462.1 GTP binding protein [Chlamydomonas reinhardtii]